ncbi:MAG: hypothetical protein DSZ23_04765, partial [Thermodesulfatator sp.]
PHVSRIGVLFTEESEETVNRMTDQIVGSDAQLIALRIDSPEELQERLDEIFRLADVLVAVPDTNIYSSVVVPRIIFQAIRYGRPFVGLSRNFTEAGALFSLDCDYEDTGRQAAEMALKILSGRRPKVRIQSPRRFTATINLHTARLLGLKIDSRVLEDFQVLTY